jgi:hypothetical protein
MDDFDTTLVQRRSATSAAHLVPDWFLKSVILKRSIFFRRAIESVRIWQLYWQLATDILAIDV